MFIDFSKKEKTFFPPVIYKDILHEMTIKELDDKSDKIRTAEFPEYAKVCDFQNLYRAHLKARRGKQNTSEVIKFEMELGRNLTVLSESLKNGTYRVEGYYSFQVHDPKERTIHALHYRDRVVQHCLCDEVLAPIMEKRLIYDNAACRTGKGTHFAINRVSIFLREFYKKYNNHGYFLKCDIQKYFDNIDHQILKTKLKHCIHDTKILNLLFSIIDSYECTPGKGLPLGNQTSQWFALYYMDELDRLVKEQMGIKFYSRYMDDCLLIHEDKDYLKKCLETMTTVVNDNLQLSFNRKTQIIPIRNGVDFLGFHFYLTDTGKVIKKVRQQTKKKYKRKLKYMKKAYAEGAMQLPEIKQVISSYHAHLSHGHCYKLRKKVLQDFVLCREEKHSCGDVSSDSIQ